MSHKIHTNCAFICCLFLLGSKLIHISARALAEILVLPPYFKLHPPGAHSLQAHNKCFRKTAPLKVLFSYDMSQTYQTSIHLFGCLRFSLMLCSLSAVLHGPAQIAPLLKSPTLLSPVLPIHLTCSFIRAPTNNEAGNLGMRASANNPPPSMFTQQTLNFLKAALMYNSLCVICPYSSLAEYRQ